MSPELLTAIQSLLAALMFLALAVAIGSSGQRRGGWNSPPTSKPPRTPPAPPFAFLLLIGMGLVGVAGCCIPSQPMVCHCPGSMTPRYSPPPKVYGEPMHPILREDGATILMPHTKFQNWIRDDPAETSSEAGKSFGP